MPVIESIISRLLYLPPRCSYYRNDVRFHGCYFEIDDGLGGLIPCVRVRSQSAARFTILYSHANAEDLGYLYIIDFLQWLAKYLYVDVIGYEYPGYGLGEMNEDSLKRCACITMNYLIDKLEIPPKNIILYGHSLGSAISVFLSVFASKTRGCGVAGVILQSCFMSIYSLVFDCRFSAKKDQYETVDIIKDTCCPVTFIHGMSDSVVPISHPKRLFLHVPPEFRYRCLFVPEAGHNNIESHCKPRSLFIDHLLDFITYVSFLQDKKL
ncbi:hypothetical protein JH06_0677 [Blastocystis sp. subtype 4]|uniref:hypothetical protein n=1 Tax=Blastocystis sp. subtype 4 TaxID=944170 RepID=UPI000711316A|nr:hypothetical protein JH06_0677 [Blastocystis sp. subtype 4]KNB45748.1 hypothetical protein JH06_0677 [Blastocystis sp. subtype 4]|eukprot:XP_014529191.1 hypothetical protein JH06_0677 [Blastocystis sp. subtype 4]